MNVKELRMENDVRRGVATTLAALQYWKREGLSSSGHERDIATNKGEFEPLTEEEIDALCAEIIDRS